MTRTSFNRYINDFLQLIFPRVCASCHKSLLYHESELCTTCVAQLPFTDFFEEPQNKTYLTFRSQNPINRAASLLYFRKKSMVQRIIHELKYKNNQKIGVVLGEILAKKMLKSGFSDGITCIVGIPITEIKRKKRGYNQCDLLIEGILKHLPMSNLSAHLQKVKNTRSQTQQHRYDRYQNQENLYTFDNAKIETHEHLLIIDDVVTTGATINEVINAILAEKPTLKISVVSIAITM